MFVGKTLAIYYGDKATSYTFNADKGIYKIECWGAMGYNGNPSGGCGGYVSGFIKINSPIPLYVYPGEVGTYSQSVNSFNGGGTGQAGGGGGSDVRLNSGEWNEIESLKSRIIVAGGGGGMDWEESPGAGGGLEGLPSIYGHGQGGSQTSGGKSSFGTGVFGIGGGNNRIDGGENPSNDGCGAGGGGYFGGSASTSQDSYSGGGGSSYISGHEGCNAIDSTSDNLGSMIPTYQSIHYSGLKFFNTNIINGISEMPSPEGGSEIGHCSYGAVRIQLYSIVTCQKYFPIFRNLFGVFLTIFILIK